MSIEVGEKVNGRVSGITNFGAFVDCGVKYDGLLHVSKMSLEKVNHPSDLVAVGDEVHVHVIDIDYTKHKLALSLYKI